MSVDVDREKVGTQQKALSINLDRRKYGAFAEIGAGQEVVRWFFRVGAAAATIAKSMSAYDMLVSDSIYGKAERYVSRNRLQNMLDHEYGLLLERLDEKRGENTEFFVFADTVAARGYKGNDDCHGWMGIKFQTAPRSEPNQIILHVRMLDIDNFSQYEALGIVGVNLIHSAFANFEKPELVIEALADNLTTNRIEIDMIKFSGPVFSGVDHRLMSLRLVQQDLSDAAMFAANGEVLQPSEVLYKKPVLIERGSFRPVTHVNVDMLECAHSQFMQEPEMRDEPEIVTLMEITMNNLRATGEIDYEDFLGRAEVVAATGATVLISDYFEYYRLGAYLARYTHKKIAMTMGIPSLRELFDENYYSKLEGGILESFGRLFKQNLKLYVYPLKDRETGQLISVERLKVAPHLHNLYEHLTENKYIESIDFYNKDYLPIFSRDVLAKIRESDSTWESMVPPRVAQIIKERKFFGYQDSHQEY